MLDGSDSTGIIENPNAQPYYHSTMIGWGRRASILVPGIEGSTDGRLNRLPGNLNGYATFFARNPSDIKVRSRPVRFPPVMMTRTSGILCHPWDKILFDTHEQDEST